MQLFGLISRSGDNSVQYHLKKGTFNVAQLFNCGHTIKGMPARKNNMLMARLVYQGMRCIKEGNENKIIPQNFEDYFYLEDNIYIDGSSVIQKVE